MSDPRPPTNVRLVLRDGREIPVDCRWVGHDRDGVAHWQVITSLETAAQVRSIRIEQLPGRTSVSLPMPVPE